MQSEYLVYNLDDLAADMGGMLGMLLGASLMAGYDWAEERAKKWLNVLARRTQNVHNPPITD